MFYHFSPSCIWSTFTGLYIRWFCFMSHIEHIGQPSTASNDRKDTNWGYNVSKDP